MINHTALQTTSRVGVVSDVVLSVVEDPVSDPDCISGPAIGVEGTVVSMTTERFDDTGEIFPAVSV